MNYKHKEIGAAREHAGQAVVGDGGLPFLFRGCIALLLYRVLEQVGETGEGAFERQEEGHDQMRGEEDRIAGAGGYAATDILSPGKGILAKVLEDAIDGDGQASDDYSML